jgi:hypothetical protein
MFAASSDPEAAAEQERERNRAAKAKQRTRHATDMSNVSRVEKATGIVRAMTPDEKSPGSAPGLAAPTGGLRGMPGPHQIHGAARAAFQMGGRTAAT